MKKFIFKVFVPTIVIFIFLLGCAELFLRSVPNDFKAKAEYMDKHASEIKILVIGSSGTAMGVKPSCFDWQPSYSCAYANQGALYNYLILSKYIDAMDSLRYVIMDATYAGLWNDGKYAQTYVKKYSIYFGFDDFKGFSNRFEISANIKDIFERLTHKSDRAAFLTCDSDGFQSRYFENIPYNDSIWKAYGKTHCEIDHTKIYQENAEQVCESNTIITKQIIELCKKRNVNVLFISMPCHPYYFEYYNPIQKRIVDSTYSALCDEYDNVRWLDYTTMQFDTDEMVNVNHLNAKGAIRFTKMLNDSIIEWKKTF